MDCHQRRQKLYKWSHTLGQAGTQYASCRVSYVGPNGKPIEGIAYVKDYDAKSKTNQQLEVYAPVTSKTEAKELAAKKLRLHNKFERQVGFTYHGDPGKVAGLTFETKSFGPWDGKVHREAGQAYRDRLWRVHHAGFRPSCFRRVLMNTAVDVRLGKVTDVNKEKRLVRCKFEDTGITSGWLPVMQHYKAIVYTESAGEHNHQYIHPSPYNLEIKTTMDGSRQIWDEEEKVIGADNSTNHQHKSHVVWWLPAIDDTVVCLYLPCFNADGFVLGGIYP